MNEHRPGLSSKLAVSAALVLALVVSLTGCAQAHPTITEEDAKCLESIGVEVIEDDGQLTYVLTDEQERSPVVVAGVEACIPG